MIKEAFLGWINEWFSLNSPLITGTVVSVDEGEMSCEVKPTNGGPNKHDVRLKPAKADKGVVMVPVVDSEVSIRGLNGVNQWEVAEVSEVDRVMFEVVAGFKLVMDKNGIVMNGGDKGGMVLVKENTRRLNSIENKFNSHVAKYNGHTHPDPLTGLSGTTTIIETTTSVTKQSDIENTEVKQ